MILTFKRKLLAALLLANLVLVLVMASLMFVSFQAGFTNYLKQVEIEELSPLSQALIFAYEEKRSWEFLKNNFPTWGLFIKFLPGGGWSDRPPQDIIDILRNPPPLPGQHDRFLPPNHTQRNGERPPNHRQELNQQLPPPKPLSNSNSLNWRLQLFDVNKNIVFGPDKREEEPLLIPLELNNEIIGWLSVTRIKWLERGLLKQFFTTQVIAVFFSACIAFALSLLVALPLGRAILKPVSLVIQAIGNIARGNLQHRVTWNNNDEFKKLVTDVNNLAQVLEENKELRRTMMADVSHELRTPLAVLQAEIEAIQDGIRPCNEERMASLHKNVRSLSRLIDDLFALSLSDAGKLSYHMKNINLMDLLERSFDLYSNLFTKEDIDLTKDFPEQKADIYADPGRLEQLFSNIFNNSFRYTDRPGKVHISAQVTADNITITIEDSAPGIPSDKLTNIFDRFFRIDKSRSRALGGAGLGLSLCKSIVEAHNGTIRAAHSQLGGLAMIISLPLSYERKDEHIL